MRGRRPPLEGNGGQGTGKEDRMPSGLVCNWPRAYWVGPLRSASADSSATSASSSVSGSAPSRSPTASNSPPPRKRGRSADQRRGDSKRRRQVQAGVAQGPGVLGSRRLSCFTRGCRAFVPPLVPPHRWPLAEAGDDRCHARPHSVHTPLQGYEGLSGLNVLPVFFFSSFSLLTCVHISS